VPGRSSRSRVVATSKVWSTAPGELNATALRKPLSGREAQATREKATSTIAKTENDRFDDLTTPEDE
jgi:hypothetical protein